MFVANKYLAYINNGCRLYVIIYSSIPVFAVMYVLKVITIISLIYSDWLKSRVTMM